MSTFFTPTLLVILSMACVTYATRASAYLLLRGRALSPRMKAVMDVAPGCVLITLLAPTFFKGHLTDLLALGLTLFAATRWSLLTTVLIAVGSTAVLRALL